MSIFIAFRYRSYFFAFRDWSKTGGSLEKKKRHSRSVAEAVSGAISLLDSRILPES